MPQNTYKESNTAPPKRQWFSWSTAAVDQRLVIAIGIMLQGLSAFLLLAFTSHLFCGKVDQSVIESAHELGLRASGAAIKNWLGLLGALSAYYCMFRWLGITAFLLLPPLYLLGHRCIYGRPWAGTNLYTTTVGALFGILWGNVALGYVDVLSASSNWTEDLVGGVGLELGIMFDGLLGWGTVLVLLVSLLIFLVYFL